MYNKIKLSYSEFFYENLLLQFNGKRNIIIFGRNGSGKSTLSRKLMVNNYSDELIQLQKEGKIQFLNGEDQILINDLTVHVYNDDFQRKYVSFSESDNFDAIVMLGNQKEYQVQIDKSNEKIKEIRHKIDTYLKTIETLDINHEKLLLDNKLKGDDNWAGRQRRIYGNKQNTKVKENKIFEIHNSVPNSSKDQVLYDLWENIYKIESTRTEDSIDEKLYFGNIHLISECLDNYNNENEILENIISKELTKEIEDIGILKVNSTPYSLRENRIIDVMKKWGSDRLEETLRILNENDKYCPICYRELSKEYINQLEKDLDRIIEEADIKSIEDRINSIQLQKFNEVQVDNRISIENQNILNTKIKDYNFIVEKIENEILVKKQNLYKELYFEDNIKDMKHKLLCVVKSVHAIKLNITEYNSRFHKKEDLIDRATKLNEKLAFF